MSQADNGEDFKYGVCSSLVAALCITVIGAVIYSNTLQVPWYFDDIVKIVRNPAIRDLGNAWNRIFEPRGLAMFSFALNYHFHGLELPFYHITNILIHLLTSFIVFLSLKRVFRSQPIIALLAALIFLSHPLQTQSVTYVVQRMTCLGGLFFFLSLYFYVRARETLLEGRHFSSLRHQSLYISSLTCAVIAVYTKQNAAILPFCILLFDRYFLPKQKHCGLWLALYLLPYFAAPLWMALSQYFFPIVDGKSLQVITSINDSAKGLTRTTSSDYEYLLSYLVTEFSVLWLYIRLLFLPYGQVLDYQYPLTTSLLTIKNSVAFLGLTGLLTCAWKLRKRMSLVSFGIFWFFISLSVESTIIPLDPVFEHRLYVPLFGFAVLVPQVLDSLRHRKAKVVILSLTVTIYAVLTWIRNDLWSRENAFYEDQYSKVPHSTRVMIALSKNYIDLGRDQEAEMLLRKVIQIDPGDENAYVNLSNILVRKQRMGEAIQLLKQGLQSNPRSGKLHNNLGVYYDLQGEPEQAIQSLLQAIVISPDYAESYTNLGVVYAGLKRWKEAERYFRVSLTVLYENPKAHYNLGVALFSLGRMSEAAEAFRQALKFAPEDIDALFNLASVYIKLGNRQGTLDLLPRLRSQNKDLAIKLEKELAELKAAY